MTGSDLVIAARIGELLDNGQDPPYTLSDLRVEEGRDLRGLKDEGIVKVIIRKSKPLVFPTQKIFNLDPGDVEDENLDYFTLDALKLSHGEGALLAKASRGTVDVSSMSPREASTTLTPMYYQGLIKVEGKSVSLSPKGKYMLEGGAYSPTQTTHIDSGWQGPLTIETLEGHSSDPDNYGVKKSAVRDTSIEDLIKKGYTSGDAGPILKLVDDDILEVEGRGRKARLKLTPKGNDFLKSGWFVSTTPYGRGPKAKRLARSLPTNPVWVNYYSLSPGLVYQALTLAYEKSGGRPVSASDVTDAGREELIGVAPRTESDERSGGHTVFSFTDRTQRWLRQLVKKGVARETKRDKRYYYEPVEET